MHRRIADRRPAALALLLALASGPAGGDWDNPADRYLDAWQAYADASCPIGEDGIRHFVYFARDRAAIRDHALLRHPRLAGAQVMYAWRQLEPERDRYEFGDIRADIDYLERHGKRLFIQLQDATFSTEYHAVPDYLLSGEFDGGEAAQFTDEGRQEGWVARRWNPAVRERFAALLAALGAAFDGDIEGINLQESAIGVSADTDPAFSAAAYATALRHNMTALKAAFPTAVTLQYANFMPGEWLPWEDPGYLRGLYAHGEAIGVGLGAPDLMPRRKGQLNHALALMHEGEFTVPLGIAVQDGNYVGETGSDRRVAERVNLVPMLHAFARDFLGVSYLFWVDQAPYFEEDVLPCLGAGDDLSPAGSFPAAR